MLFFCRVKSGHAKKNGIWGVHFFILSEFLFFFSNSLLLNSLLWSLFCSACLSQPIAAWVGTAVTSTVNLHSPPPKKGKNEKGSRLHHPLDPFGPPTIFRSCSLEPQAVVPPSSSVSWSRGRKLDRFSKQGVRKQHNPQSSTNQLPSWHWRTHS